MENNLTKGNIKTTMIKFAVPFILANLLQAFYGAADLIIVGQFTDSANVSAVAIGSQAMQTITGIIVGLTTGGTVLIGQYMGAKKKEDIADTIGNMVIMFSIIGVILSLIIALFTGKIVTVLKTPSEAIAYTHEYIFICSIGIIFIVGYNAVSGILRGIGDSKTPLKFVAVACMVNIILDLILVGIMKAGAEGAAIATISAQGVSLFLAVLSIIRKNILKVKISIKNFKLNMDKLKKIFILGLPIAVQDMLVNISFLIITAIINTLGVTTSAAVGVTEKIIIFLMIPPTAFSSAIAVMTAQNIAAKQEKRAKESLKIGIILSLAIGIICFIFCQFSGEILARIFTSDTEVVTQAAVYLKSYTIDCIMVAFMFCMNGFFSGCGHTTFTLIHSLIATFLFRIPIAYFFCSVHFTSLYKTGLASPIASSVSVIICFIYFKLGKWRKNKLLDNMEFSA